MHSPGGARTVSGGDVPSVCARRRARLALTAGSDDNLKQWLRELGLRRLISGTCGVALRRRLRTHGDAHRGSYQIRWVAARG
jgi:hypothetical protein